ncbi:MAG TPA: helix-turn-helix transcriptional regulator [Candidatus Acidoferrales bacterium]|nr:helix-turn-helix transcriptional regulator [Candidatus Acidoferrales bacterium]
MTRSSKQMSSTGESVGLISSAREGRMLTPAAQDERLRRILEIIESGSLCTIGDLAVEFNLSASHLQHLFKAQTGCRLGRRLVEQRLHRAALLLLQSNMSVKEVAYAVGYKHPPSFVRAFERFFEQAPGHYRQEMLTERRIG